MVTGPDGERPSMGTLFTVGGTAGAAAAGLTNPLDLITTRLMAQGEGQAYGRGIVSALQAARQEGSAALWRGTLPRMAAAFPYAAIQFSLFEIVMAWLSPPDEAPGSEWLLPVAASASRDGQADDPEAPKRRRRNTSSVFGFKPASQDTTKHRDPSPTSPHSEGR